MIATICRIAHASVEEVFIVYLLAMLAAGILDPRFFKTLPNSQFHPLSIKKHGLVAVVNIAFLLHFILRFVSFRYCP